MHNSDLFITNCDIKGSCAAATSGSLSTLRLFNNQLGSEGFAALSSVLRGGHPALENLDLGGNDAGEEAVVALLTTVADTQGRAAVASKLSVLEIGGNKFGDMAMAALNALKEVMPHLDVAHDKPVQDAEEAEEFTTDTQESEEVTTHD